MKVEYDDGRRYVDREALAQLTHRSPETIRKRCEVAYYVGKTPMYDEDAAWDVLDRIAARPNQRPRQRRVAA